MNKLIVALSVVLLADVVPAGAQSIIPSPIGPASGTAFSVNGGVNDIAYNDKAGVYLHVWGHPTLWGAFVGANGGLIGAPFIVSTQSPSDSFPRVAYSKGSADDVFWVTFTSELGGGRYIYSRLVRYAPGQPNNHTLGPIQPVSIAAGGPLQTPGGIAFDAQRRQFFATWDGFPLGDWEAWGQVWQLSGSAAAPAIAPASAVLNISASPNAQGGPNIAFDWQHNRYLIVYWGEHPSSDLISGAWARTVTFDGAMNPSYSPVITLSSGVGRPIEPNVVYAPELDRFLTYWTSIVGLSRDVSGGLTDHNGSLLTAVFPIMATPSNEGAADADYNPSTKSIVMAGMRDQTKYAQGVVLTGAGALVEYFQATSVVPTGPYETLYPQVIAAPGGRFGISYINGFQFGYVDVLQAAVVGAGGPTPGTPPCTVEPSPSVPSISLTGAAQSQNITVTASTASCAWTASASASWITITAGASGAGPGTTTFAVARNTTGATRTGSVTVGSGAVSIQQAPSIGNAAVHDMNGDRSSDLMWHNDSSGNIAVWNLVGHTVTQTYMLTTGGIDRNWEVVGTGDLTGDGFADIVWRHRPTGRLACWTMQNGQIAMTQFLIENGAVAGESDPGWEIGAVGDLDGDGRSDIVWQHNSGVLAAWFMNGVTVLRRAVLSSGVSSAGWTIAGAGDLNMDGKADLVWQNHVTGDLGAWLMDGNVVISQGSLSIDNVDTNWKVRGVGDTNRDGSADILWQHQVTGHLAVWYLINFNVVGTRWLSINQVTDLNWHVVGPG